MKIYEKKNFPRTSRDFKSMLERGTISFDNAVQRSFVWKNTAKDNRMSMLIDTMMRGLCVPPLYCNCIFTDPKDKVYDFVDGKQRVMTVIKYLNDEFPLIGIPTFTMEDGSELDLNGKRFSELPEDFQDNIKLFSFTVNYYENMDQDDVEELFRRLNNGRPLSAIELTRATANSKKMIREIASHKIFQAALNEKSMAGYVNEDIAIKTWILFYGDTKSFETRIVRPTMRDSIITDEQTQEILQCYDQLLEEYELIKKKETKESARVCRKIFKKTHMLSLMPIIRKSIADSAGAEKVADWIEEFFKPTKEASVMEQYNENAKAGSAKAEAIKAREDALEESYSQYMAS